MYPNEFFGLFPPFPRTDDVFVAMSFDAAFTQRWERVLEPALSRILRNGTRLRPKRVDLAKAGNSILTEILSYVARSVAVVADITAMHTIDGRAVRNANVLYEVGLAHAVRLPEEVLLFRSDKLPLDFDVANVRVHHYDPDGDPAGSIALVASTVQDCLRELDLRRHFAVERAIGAMDAQTMLVLAEANGGGAKSPGMSTVGELLSGTSRLAAVRRLLDIGAIETKIATLDAENIEAALDGAFQQSFSFHATPLGEVLFRAYAERLGVLKQELRDQIEKHVPEIAKLKRE